MREVLSSRACITPGVGFQDSSSISFITRHRQGSWRRGCDSKIQIPSDSPLIIPSCAVRAVFAARTGRTDADARPQGFEG